MESLSGIVNVQLLVPADVKGVSGGESMSYAANVAMLEGSELALSNKRP